MLYSAYIMHKWTFYIGFFISIVYSVAIKCPLQCDPSQCQDPNCSNGLKPVKIGCNCCETCIKAKDESKHCFYIPPGIPLPPLPESEMCPNGFYCDRSTRTCKSKKN